MDYATQSSRVGARVPYSLLRGTASAAIYYHFVGALSGYASWCALGTLARTHTCPHRDPEDPTDTVQCSIAYCHIAVYCRYCGAAIRYPTYPVILCTLLK